MYILVILGLFLTGCGASTQQSELHSTSLPGVLVENEVAEQLLGRYALRIQLATVQKLPILGDSNSLAYLNRIADIVQDGQGLAIRERACRLEFGSNSLVDFSIAENAVRAIPETNAPLRAWEENGVIRFAQDESVSVIGARLDDPTNDALPSRPNDPRIIDVEGDGKPGITGKISASVVSGQIYLIQRSFTSYAGSMNEIGILTGLVKDRTELAVVDASNFLLKTAGSITSMPDPDPSKSRVTLIRTASDATCDDIDWDNVSID